MRGTVLLAVRHALHARGQTVILALCCALTLSLPIASRVVVSRYERDLTARAATTPLIGGAKGNRFDLTLSTLYFRMSGVDPLPFGAYEARRDEARDEGLGVVVPMSIRYTARGVPIVGVGAEYFQQRGLRSREGTLPLMMGDVVLGASVAERLALGVGQELYSDPKQVYDISKPSALVMNVCGVMEATGTPDDDVVFVDLKTVWVLEGVYHGHADEVDRSLLLAESDENRMYSGALIEANRVTPDNVYTFHMHEDPARLPLTSMIVFPSSEKAATILKARVNTSKTEQMVVPSEVVDDLMSFVFRIRSVFDALGAVLVVTTVLLTSLVIALSVRVRAREFATMHRIGCSRWTVVKMQSLELGVIVAVGLVLAGLIAASAALGARALLFLFV